MPGDTTMNRIKCIHTRPSLGLSAAGFTLLLGLMALVLAVSANEANLTRFGPKTYMLEQGIPTNYSATFKAIDGPAELVFPDEGIDRINFYLDNLTATIKAMNELGFEQLGPISGGSDFGIVFFFDPDGIKVKFAGPTAE